MGMSRRNEAPSPLNAQTMAQNMSAVRWSGCLLLIVALVASPAPSEDKTEKAATQQAKKVETTSDKNPDAKTDQPAQVEIKRSSKAARAKGEITFDDLKFEIEKDAPFDDQMITKDIKELDGKTVRLSGWILPTTLYRETEISQFVLVRDNRECCFGPGAALYDCVMVEMVPGKTTDFQTRAVTVRGKLKIDTKRYKYPGGRGPRGASHMAVFMIAGESVK